MGYGLIPFIAQLVGRMSGALSVGGEVRKIPCGGLRKLIRPTRAATLMDIGLQGD